MYSPLQDAGAGKTAQPQAQPLRWWSAAALAVLSRELDRVASAWAERWAVAVERATAFNAHEAEGAFPAPGEWRELAADLGGVTSGCWWGLAAGADPVARLADALYGAAQAGGHARAAGTMAQAVAARALRELEDELVAALRPLNAVTSTRAPVARAWSGDVRACIPWCGDLLWLHVSGANAAALLEPARRRWSGSLPRITTSVASAVANRPVRLRVELNATELDLGTLQSLRVGDVLTLSHSLDTPLNVCADTPPSANGPGPVLCTAYLGTRHGKRAVELAQGGGA